MGYKLLVWNIKHFQGKELRLKEIASRIKAENPDIFGIIEFLAKKKVRSLVRKFPEYDFGMTDSKRSIEIIVGWKRKKFAQAIYTQRREFRVKEENLRPGALFSFKQKGKPGFDNILFLHTDSGKTKRDYNNRQIMFAKIWKLCKVLNKLETQNGNARLVALGDLNTMGKSGKKKPKIKGISASQEIEKLKIDALKANMQVLEKDQKLTYRSEGGSLKGNLDHVIASQDLTFKTRTNQELTYEISVKGWIQEKGKKQTQFIREISDHCYLVGEVA